MTLKVAILAIALAPFAARAEQPKVQVDSILGGLNNPTAVVLRPGTDELLVSESGAGRILRVAVGSPAKATPLITGFPVTDAPANLGFKVGPLGIAFIDRNVFAVGSGGSKLGQEIVRLFSMPSDDNPLPVDSARQSLGPFPASSESTTGEGFFYSVLTLPEMVLVTSHGDDAGYVLRSVSLQGKTFSGLRPLIKTKPLTGAGNPTALAITKRGELVVGQSGSFDKPNDAILSFFNPKNGKLLLTLPTGMHDIFALAYHPQSGNLYALDFAFADSKDAGLYRIDAAKKDGKPVAVGVKLATLQRPTGMAFNGDGALYVTVLGDGKQTGAKSGQLLKITGLQ